MKNKTILLGTVFFVSACGISPILHHTSATDPTTLTDQSHAENFSPTANPSPSAGPAAACALHFPVNGLCASVAWDAPLNDGDEGKFTLKFWSAPQAIADTGVYADPQLTAFAKLWMPDMGHGSSPIHFTHALDANGKAIPGVYRGTNVYFIMPGAWELHIQLKDGTHVREEAILPIQIAD